MSDAAHHAEMRLRSARLLETCRQWIRPDQHAILSELIDANESGIALDMLSEMLQEVEATLDAKTVCEAIGLAERMHMDVATRERFEHLGRG
jgi:hypothetical protein